MESNVIEEETDAVDFPDLIAVDNDHEQEGSKEIPANSETIPPLINSEKITIVVLCICQFVCDMSVAILSIFYPIAEISFVEKYIKYLEYLLIRKQKREEIRPYQKKEDANKGMEDYAWKNLYQEGRLKHLNISVMDMYIRKK
ncbi:hypothetical protein GQR58_015744 [Nymphon striatum]|nr:hypothetical protein GQR58_015744 [Nymphon striatum]